MPGLLLSYFLHVQMGIIQSKIGGDKRKKSCKPDDLQDFGIFFVAFWRLFRGRWGIRTPDPLGVNQMLWTSWAKRPCCLIADANVVQFLNFAKDWQIFFEKNEVTGKLEGEVIFFLMKLWYFGIVICCKSSFINLLDLFIKTINLIYIIICSIFVSEK